MGSDAGFEGCAGYGGLISIHAPRMGIDVETCVFAQPEIYISIHAPRMGIDVRCLLTRTGKHYFNPRSPDGERLVDFRTVGLRLEISIHAPPDGERHGLPCGEVASRFISIHAPRMGSDIPVRGLQRQSQISIHAPRMGSDLVEVGDASHVGISIHAPRMGSDGGGMFLFNRKLRF